MDLYDEKRTFRVITQNESFEVEEYGPLEEQLDILQRDGQGFVRLEMTPPLEDMCYWETCFDPKAGTFFTCILEEREDGQGFRERSSKKVEKYWYRRLLKKKQVGSLHKFFFARQLTGVQRRVVVPDWEERVRVVPFELDSPVYDEKGLYGAVQGSAMRVSADSPYGMEIRKIVRKYYPQYSDAQVNAFLKKLGSEGCGYVVIVNILFDYFKDKAEAFLQTFGFPLYGENGDFNYTLLLVDFYAATDNHYADGFVDRINYQEDRNEKEKGTDYDATMDETGWGTPFEQREYRTRLYLKNKGVKLVGLNCVAMAPGLVRRKCLDGFYIIIILSQGYIQNEDGSHYAFCRCHAMVITGVTEDGRYIVATWGLKKYVDPTEVVEKDGKATEITYELFWFG